MGGKKCIAVVFNELLRCAEGGGGGGAVESANNSNCSVNTSFILGKRLNRVQKKKYDRRRIEPESGVILTR